MLFAVLVPDAVSTLQMVLIRRTRDWHTKAAPENLPRATNGNSIKETDQAAPTGLSTGSGLSAASPAKAGPPDPAQRADNQPVCVPRADWIRLRGERG